MYKLHMTVKLQKIGNSYMATVPRNLAKKAGLKPGMFLRPEIKGSTITFKKAINRVKGSKKDNMAMVGHLNIPNFDLEQSIKDIKEGAYERFNLP